MSNWSWSAGNGRVLRLTVVISGALLAASCSSTYSSMSVQEKLALYQLSDTGVSATITVRLIRYSVLDLSD